MTTSLHPLAVTGKHYAQGSLCGYVETTYDVLVALMGEPHTCDGDKTTVEWSFVTQSGHTFHVYDWKVPTTPRGRYRWHIGGTTQAMALAAFNRFTGLPVIKFAGY